MSAIRIAALVPAYQASATIAAVVRGTAARVSPVVVVDDGSTDATGEVARAAGATVLRQEPNAGKGAALARGFRHLVEGGFTHALTLDADGQHLPEEIPLLVDAARAEPDAIVVGVRRKEGHEIRPLARFGNVVADSLMRLLAGQELPDTQSGFRVYPLGATLALGASGTRYDFETEVLFRAARRRMTLVGVPVRVHYPPIAERVSHFRPLVDTLRIIHTIVRILVGLDA
ncbi:MAG TPA: glycosyltransferase family 2 protein [Candidatus Eisenbacteria bacterium]|nr:glycosyltransferase family 2 protein [Candidatus Eisenbacteria bacterium]